MTWWTIACNDLRINLRDKMFLLWLLIFPLLFAFLFGAAFRDSPERDQKVSLHIVDLSRDFLSRILTEELRHEKYSIEIRADIDEDAIRTLVIPENFTENILAGKQVELRLLQKEEHSLEAGQTAYSHTLKGVIKILARVAKTDPRERSDLEARFEENDLDPLIILKREYAGKTKTVPSGFIHSVPSSTVIFLLFTVLMYGGIGILQERKQGILARLSTSPAAYAEIIGGKWLSRVILGLLQVVVLFTAGGLLFKIHLGSALGGIFVISLVFSSAISGLSIFLGSVIDREEILIVVNIIGANLMAALGGCWWPMEIVPRTVRTVGYLLPTGWVMDAFHKLIFFGRDFSSVLTHVAVLGGMTLVFLILAVRFFRIQSST